MEDGVCCRALEYCQPIDVLKLQLLGLKEAEYLLHVPSAVVEFRDDPQRAVSVDCVDNSADDGEDFGPDVHVNPRVLHDRASAGVNSVDETTLTELLNCTPENTDDFTRPLSPNISVASSPTFLSIDCVVNPDDDGDDFGPSAPVELDLLSNPNLPPPELLSKYTTIEYTLSRLRWLLPLSLHHRHFLITFQYSIHFGIGVLFSHNEPWTSHIEATRAFLIYTSRASSTGGVSRADAPLTRVAIPPEILDMLFLPAVQLVPAHREDNSNNQPAAASCYQIFTMFLEPNQLIVLRDAVVRRHIAPAQCSSLPLDLF
ncbi:hypothetical protein BKA62DRAFT_834981 [Auriculariales sp. MPI-PUGE-AT-0066]|nr:hypothetical protein BKA62DRAFT_834981 [Auriculariales sp. MPI-PUGE-AT-0066]